MDIMLGDQPLITEETFDFEACSPFGSFSEEADVNPAVLCPSPHLVVQPIDLNVSSKVDASLELKWSPLSAQGMEEITKEANRLARELQKENMERHLTHALGISSMRHQAECSSFLGQQLKAVGISSNHQINELSSPQKIDFIDSAVKQSKNVFCSGQQLNMFLRAQTEGISSKLNIEGIHSSVQKLKQIDTSNPGHSPDAVSAPKLHSADIPLPVVISSPGYRSNLLSEGTVSPRSPRRETYVIRDSPVRNLLPNIDLISPPIIVPAKGRSPAKRAGGESATPEKRKRGNGIMRSSAPLRSPGKQRDGAAHNVRPSQNMKPSGNLSSAKVPVRLPPTSVRPTGIPAPSSRLPVPKSMEPGIPMSAKPSVPRTQSGPVRPSAQRGSLLRPPSRLVPPKKSSLLGPIR
ncbi:proline/serine-rich coiled-coil protein 1 [Discoglossus pictus]